MLINPGAAVARYRLVPTVETRLPLPRFNVAPSTLIPVIVQGPAGERQLAEMRWGFAPRWLKPGGKMRPQINARSEGIVESRMFAPSLPERRCIIPSDGFYEWEQIAVGKRGQPWHIRLRDRGLMSFAGLWTPDASGEPTCAIVTTGANELMAAFHHRMPCVLGPTDEDAWLDPTITEPGVLSPLLRQYPPELMEAFPVSTAVNSPRNDGPRLVLPLAG